MADRSTGGTCRTPLDAARYYQSTSSGLHHGCLTGGSGTDFDLHLYFWRVIAFSGGGTYAFSYTRPN